MQKELAQPDRMSWLRLWHVPGVGTATFHHLLRCFGSPFEALRAPVVRLRQCGVSEEVARAIAGSDPDCIDADLRWLEAADHHLLCFDEARYPPRLREIASPPPILFVCGDWRTLHRPQIAIVGSRNASRGGADFAAELAAHLADRGLTITSGLAQGIDGNAHRGCLRAGGSTVAVMGTAPDRIYPSAHRPLAAQIPGSGALVTEFAIGTPLRPENFPQRNRIISGLSLGVVVVEAAQASGSLITARLALEQGREVYAVPGAVRNPLARGCHALIRQGAKLVETVDDILEELPAELLFSCVAKATSGETVETPAASDELSEEQMLTLKAMGYDPISMDDLIDRTGLTASGVSSILLRLELTGKVAAQPGGLFVRVGPETG
jgi:DNA processing protein